MGDRRYRALPLCMWRNFLCLKEDLQGWPGVAFPVWQTVTHRDPNMMSFVTQLRVQPKSPKSQSNSTSLRILCHPPFTALGSMMVGKSLAAQSEVHCRGQVVRWILSLRQPLPLFYTGSNQAVLKGNFWISLFVQCSWMRHLVHVLSNLKADLSHRS